MLTTIYGHPTAILQGAKLDSVSVYSEAVTMTTVDHNIVRRQATELASLYFQPQAFVRKAKDILERHADYSMRQSMVVAIRAPLSNRYGTPRPVLRTILKPLRRKITQDPQGGFVIARALWKSGSREERTLASEILGLCVPASPYVIADELNHWVMDINDSEAADILGLSAGGALLAAAPREFFGAIRNWLHSSQRWIKRFAIASLIGLVRTNSFSDVRSILDLIKNTMIETDVEVRSAVAWLLRELNEINPIEVVRFLREWAMSVDRHAHWVIRQTLDALDPETGRELTSLMREGGYIV